MPDPWLTEAELEEHNKEVENHPLKKQGDEAAEAAEKEHEEARKEAAKNQKKVEKGELVPVYANGAIVGYRDAEAAEGEPAEQEPEEPVGISGNTEPTPARRGRRPKAEGKGGAPENNDTGTSGEATE